MKITIMAFMLSSYAAMAGIIEHEVRPKRAEMTISYESKKIKDVPTGVMVVAHPSGITSFYDRKELEAWRAAAVQRKLEIEIEIINLDKQLAEIDKVEKPK